MKQMLKKITALLMTGLLNGCVMLNTSSSSSSESGMDISEINSSYSSSSSTNNSSSNNNKKTEVIFYHTMNALKSEYLNAFIKSFEEENENIKVTPISAGSLPMLQNDILSNNYNGKVATMALCYRYNVDAFVDNNRSISLNQYINDSEYGFEEDDIRDFQNVGFWNEGSDAYGNDGTFYSIPFSEFTDVLYINTDLMMEYGFKDPNDETKPYTPQTWDEMWKLCKDLKELNPSITPLGIDSEHNMFITLCEQYGIPYASFDSNGNKSVDFNNSNTKDLMQELKDNYDKGYFKIRNGGKLLSGDLLTKRTAMCIGSTLDAPYYLNDPEFDYDKNNIDISPIPQKNINNPKSISQGFVITLLNGEGITKEQTLASWLFAKHITSTYNSAVYALLTGCEPVRESSYDEYIYQKYLNVPNEGEKLLSKVANVASNLKGTYFSYPAFMDSDIANKELKNLIVKILNGTNIDTALGNAKNLICDSIK